MGEFKISNKVCPYYMEEFEGTVYFQGEKKYRDGTFYGLCDSNQNLKGPYCNKESCPLPIKKEGHH